MSVKKLLALLLCLAMVLSLCACGSTDADTEESSADSETSSAVADSANDADAADVADAAAADEESASAEDLGDPVVLTAINGFTESDFAAECIVHFCDLVEEKSNGNITFNRYFGGSFCTVVEEFGYVSSGAADFCTILQDTALEQLLYWNTAVSGSDMQEAMDVCNYIFFENPETAALCEAQAEAAGVKILGVQTSGLIANVCTTPVSSYADMAGMSYGTDFASAAYAAMGFNIVSTTISDVYEALSRGMIDCSSSSLSAVLAYKWYEVAPYIMVCSTSSTANFFTFNSDRWNSLTTAQQELLQECVDETIAWEMEYYDTLVDGWIQTLTDEGCTVGYFTEEDELEKLKIQITVTYQSYLDLAESLGQLDEYNMISEATFEYLGFDMQELLDEYGT